MSLKHLLCMESLPYRDWPDGPGGQRESGRPTLGESRAGMCWKADMPEGGVCPPDPQGPAQIVHRNHRIAFLSRSEGSKCVR